jgi:hypothetical protein
MSTLERKLERLEDLAKPTESPGPYRGHPEGLVYPITPGVSPASVESCIVQARVAYGRGGGNITFLCDRIMMGGRKEWMMGKGARIPFERLLSGPSLGGSS